MIEICFYDAFQRRFVRIVFINCSREDEASGVEGANKESRPRRGDNNSQETEQGGQRDYIWFNLRYNFLNVITRIEIISDSRFGLEYILERLFRNNKAICCMLN